MNPSGLSVNYTLGGEISAAVPTPHNLFFTAMGSGDFALPVMNPVQGTLEVWVTVTDFASGALATIYDGTGRFSALAINSEPRVGSILRTTPGTDLYNGQLTSAFPLGVLTRVRLSWDSRTGVITHSFGNETIGSVTGTIAAWTPFRGTRISVGFDPSGALDPIVGTIHRVFLY